MTPTPTRRLRFTLLAAAALTLPAGACAPFQRVGSPAAASPALAATIDSIVSAAPLHRTHWGIQVYDAGRGRVLYELNPEKHFVPASNTKLVVSAAALARLGEDYRYTTDVYALRRSPLDTVASGIVLAGSGDPTMSATFLDTDFAALEMLADSIARAGVRRVQGEVVVDASRFDDELVHSTWEVGDLPWYYAAPVSAFAVAEGTARFVVWPGLGPGAGASVRPLAPAQAVSITAAVTTDTVGAESDLEPRYSPERDAPLLTGSVPFGAPPDTLTLTVSEPAAFAGRVLEAALEARGIQVEGGVRVVRDPAEARALASPLDPRVERVATWTSPPMRDIVAGILQPSNNWIAEQVLKTLGAEAGHRGTWSTGLDVEREWLFGTVGIDSTAIYLRDASGLSAQNLLTPEAVVRLLGYAMGQPWGDAYRRAMAMPGVEGTTLSDRMPTLEGRVFAKTGTIVNVNALSGYLDAGSGDTVIFSILTNGSGLPASLVRPAIDAIVEAIAADAAAR